MNGVDNCPEGESRGVKELVVKLIVAHLTAVVAFCHLQSLRNERLDTFEPVLFLLSPLIVVFQTAAGLIVIHYYFIDSMIRAPKSWADHITIYARRWNLLFARKPQPGQRIEEDHRPKPGEAWVNLGRLLVMSGTLFQFTATIFLYRRRRNLYGWDSLTIVDHRTFELAVGGAAVSVLSILLVLKLPGFVEAPAIPYTQGSGTTLEQTIPYTQGNGTTLEQMILFCRGDARRLPQWYLPFHMPAYVPVSWATTWFFCVFSSTYEGELRWLDYMCFLYTTYYETINERTGLDVSVSTFYCLAVVFFVVGLVVGKMSMRLTKPNLLNFERKYPWIVVPLALLLYGAYFSSVYIFILLVLLFLSPLGFCIPPAMLGGPICIAWVKGLETHMLFSQVPFGTRDDATKCLLLWRDPLAEYLWSLV